jgi:ribosomal protein S18 acetylase RimI-like enzyme
MQPIELVSPQPKDAPELARIAFEAFAGIHDRHQFPRDFPTLEVARHAFDILLTHPTIEGVAAKVNGKWVGSNFLHQPDEVAGVGPITVDPAFDGRGAGRALMQGLLDIARRRGISQVRLLQDSFNTKSLSLYCSLGFEVVEPVGVMDARPAPAADPSVRPITEADLPAIETLSREHHRFSRRNEVALNLHAKLPAFLREHSGRVTGYLIPGFFGHGAAEGAADAVALAGEVARHVPAEQAVFFCPMTQGEFYRAALKAGHRLRKLMTYMALGPFDPPRKIWMPSIGL